MNLKLIEDMGINICKKLCDYEIDLAIISAIPDKSNIAALHLYKEKWFLPFRRKFYDGRKIVFIERMIKNT